MLTIYKASAGSGKTFTLAKEYIHTLLGRKDHDTGTYSLRPAGQHAHRSILAITFSVKATDEMKRRIIDELHKLADTSAKSDYRKDFIADFGCDAEQLADAASAALHDLLFDFSLFNISTIDSFFQSVLRTFAREIDLTGNYDIELNDTEAIGAGVGEMFNSINFDDSDKSRRLERWLTLFMRQRVDNGDNFNILNRGSGIHNQLVGTLSKMMDEDFRIHSQEILDYFREDPERLTEFEKALRRMAEEAKRQFIDNARATLDIYSNLGFSDDSKVLNRYVLGALQKWAIGAIPDNESKLSKSVRDAADSRDARYTAAFRKQPIPPELDASIAKTCSQASVLLRRMALSKLIISNIYAFGLLGYLLDFIARYRHENNTILISDTNELLRRVIKDDLTPFIYERLGYFLDHFLIDEFQDTSRMQWSNLMPLVMESLSRDGDNLIIGDEKQCIYRFRNSDPSLLSSDVKRQVLSQMPESVKERGIDVSDNTNWRSSREVVRFNNTLFPALAAISGGKETYANTIQQVSRTHIDHDGYVDLRMFNNLKKDEYADATLERMAQHIKRQLSDGYRPRDIAVLVRRHSEGELVISHLLQLMEDPESDFPRFAITSQEAVRISASPVIKLIISVLRIIDTSDATTSKRDKSMRELAQLVNRFEYLYNHQGLTATDALNQAILRDTDIDSLTQRATSMDCVNLPSLVERIITLFTSEAQRTSHNIYLSAFQDLVIDFCSKGLADVHSFLQWWDDRGHTKSLSTPSDLDALTVMTIHASKGLQYGCVHVPFANWTMAEDSKPFTPKYSWFELPAIDGIDQQLIPQRMPMEIKSSMASTPLASQYEAYMAQQRVDNINLLYVAFTRAIDELIVTTGIPSGNNVSESFGQRLTLALAEAHGDGSQWTTDLAELFTDGESLCYGSPTRRKTDEAKAVAASPAMPPYAITERHSAWTLTRVDDLCDLNRARDRGIFMHDVLSLVRKRSDLDVALRRRAYRVGLDEAEAQAFHAELRAALADPRVARWFDDTLRVLNERTILLADGSKYRPDRVVWTADGDIHVIDYKFGEKHTRRYSRQVANYMAMMSDMYPDAVVKGFIWYPESGEITPVDSTAVTLTEGV